MSVFLRAQHISKRFGGVIALEDVTLEIEEGQIVGLVGENGSGKSTFIKIISGVYTPDKGDIYIRERHYKHLTPIQAIREGISVIYQDFALCPNLSVAENIAITRWVFSGRRTINWRQMYHEASRTLRQLSDHIPLGAEVSRLSTADRQIVAIARALLENAKLIIMDEPTTALTEKEISSLFNILKILSSRGISILFVSHKLQEIKAICSRVIVFRDGRKVFDGASDEADIKALQMYMTGRVVETLHVGARDAKEDISLFKVEGLTLEPYFADINFELKRREVLGITGLLGSGRRELALALVGLMKAAKGGIEIEGQPVKIKNVWDAWNLGIAYVPEDRITEGLHLPCSITANILLPNLRRFSSRFGFFSYKKHRSVGEHWRQGLGIKAPSSETPVMNLSGGNQQRVVLAKCLSTEPKILILNSPTMGVDVASKAAIHRLIRELCEKGIGIILFSDDIPELLQTCNRIVILKRGRIANVVNSYEVTESELYHMLLEE